MIDFTTQKSAPSVRQVISKFVLLDANKLLKCMINSGLRQVFAPSLRQVRQVMSQVIDLYASSLRHVCPYVYTYISRRLSCATAGLQGRG